MSSWEREMAQPRTSQTGHRHGSRFEETRERLSSLIPRNPFELKMRDCYWMLLAESSTDRFVILQGCRFADQMPNDEFKLVAAGNVDSDWYTVYWLGAKDLARVVHKIMMRKKRNEANDSDIVQKCAFHGLLIYDLVTDIFGLRRPMRLVPPLLGLEMQSLGSEMQMLSRVLEPPSVLAAASRLMIAQGPLGTVASSSAPWVGYRPWAAVGCTPRYLIESLVWPLFLVLFWRSVWRLRSSADYDLEAAGQAHRIGGGAAAPVQQPSVGYRPWAAVGRTPRYLIESLVWHLFLVLFWRSEYDVRRLRSSADYDLEAGGQAHRIGGGAAAPVQQPSEVSQRLDAVMVQAYAAFIPVCVTAYPLLKDAPDYIKFIIFGGLAFTNLGLFVGILSNSVARRGLAIRLVSFSAIAVLTFCVASQLSSRIYVALTALVGVVLNLIIMLLPF
ncbi:uncharacterized protein LOC120686190 isoform X1 [Panicum virgatum]|uniref:Uncharacterized protein n=1 Tax=Panicum virgatum TaxID=38727 RepID=A0A8T0PBM2_PANVG|nr:uncharacterized protein LOC120686190 isoform X1 [Panicum virgatum]KAG2555974.1 hypothetical protein PVAP13_8NG059501 [Panicum virgatum]